MRTIKVAIDNERLAGLGAVPTFTFMSPQLPTDARLTFCDAADGITLADGVTPVNVSIDFGAANQAPIHTLMGETFLNAETWFSGPRLATAGAITITITMPGVTFADCAGELIVTLGWDAPEQGIAYL